MPETATAIPHHIAGQARSGAGPAIAVTSPLDGSELGSVHAADAAVVDETVQVAQTAAAEWAALTIKDRVQPLFRFKQLCEERITELGELVSRENGKTVAEGIAGIQKGLEVVEYACSLPAAMPDQTLEVSRGVDCSTRRVPLGVVAGITPFNFPAMVPLWMLPLAIASGNAFILKPSEQVPLTALRLCELLEEAGLPPGVCNVVNGDRGTVEAILDHPGIAAVGFVGSTPVARAVHQRGTAAGKRVLALGGAKNHLVVLPDAEPEATARNIVASACGCAGQRCMAASAMIAVGDCSRVIEAIVEVARGIRLGEDMGAIINPKSKARIEDYVARADRDGCRVLLDGRGASVDGRAGGNWVGPTIIDQVPSDHPCACDEIFGPVLSIMHVDSLDQALAIENASPYGNAASLFTASGAAAAAFERRANAGMVGINIGVPVPREPFSFGGWNDSRFGIGDITGQDGVRFWTQSKKVTRKWNPSDARDWMS